MPGISIGGIPGGIPDVGVAATGGYHRKVLATATANLIGYWKMDEHLGTVAIDSSPERNDGAYTGVVLGAAGIGDGRTSPTFDNTNDFNNIYSAALNTDFSGTEGTLMAWGRVSGSGVWTDANVRELVHIADANNADRIIMERSATDNQLSWIFDVGATLLSVSRDSNTTLDFFHMAITWSDGADEVIAYFDGAQEGTTQTGVPTWTSNLGSTRTLIGARLTTPLNVWDGNASHVALWTTPLAAAQISNLASLS